MACAGLPACAVQCAVARAAVWQSLAPAVLQNVAGHRALRFGAVAFGPEPV